MIGDGKKDEGVSNIMLAHPLLVLFAGLVRAVIRVGALLKFMGLKAVVKQRWRCMLWPKRKRKVERVRISMLKMRWIPVMQKNWVWMLLI